MTFTCDEYGSSFSRKCNLKKHQTSRYRGTLAINTSSTSATYTMKENDDQQLKDSQWSSLNDNIINKKSESGEKV